MHVIRRLIERREPAHRDVCLVHQLIREVEHLLDELRIQQQPVEREAERRNHARALAAQQLHKQHEQRKHERVQQHQEENRCGALIRARHFKRLDKRRQRNRFACAGVAEDRRRFRPHIADKTVLHADQRRRDQDEHHIKKRRKNEVHKLSPRPCRPLHADEVVRHARAEKRDVRKQQNEQQRDQKHGVRVAEGPDERLERLHRRVHVVGEACRLVGKQEAQDERERERQHDADVLAPHAEVIAHDRPHLRKHV